MALKKLVAGNWKMHGLSSDLARDRGDRGRARHYPAVDVALCVPAILIERAVARRARFRDRRAGRPPCRQGRAHRLHLGADAARRGREPDHRRPFRAPRGAARKRRGSEGKAEAALSIGLDVILCVGESLDVREAGRARRTVLAQLDALASGRPRGERRTGGRLRADLGDRDGQGPDHRGDRRDARRDPRQPACSASALRASTCGSSTAARSRPRTPRRSSASPNVDGALVGGASLTAADFMPIVAAAAGRSRAEWRSVQPISRIVLC